MIYSFKLPNVSAQNKKDINLKVIQTSDIHGTFFSYDFINDKNINASLSQCYTYIKQSRNSKSSEVILLDNGDILQGQPIIYYYNYEKPNDRNLCSDIMNFMSYDAATVGNHDIETGPAVYDKIVKETNFPWLAANAIDIKSKKPYFKPYHIIKKGDAKIAVLGLITPNIPEWLPPSLWSGIEFQDMIEAAKYWVAEIQKKEKPDVLIGLFHSGNDYASYGRSADTYKNENASLLVAQQVMGFDMVFTGHDHVDTLLWAENPKKQKIPILDPGAYAKRLSVVDVVLKYDKKMGKYNKTVTAQLVDVRNLDIDKEFTSKFQAQFDEAKIYTTKPIGEITQELTSRDAYFGNSAFIDMIHDIQLSVSESDISFAAPLSFDAKIPAGTIYVRDLFNLYKYENLLYTIQLTGQEVKDYLEYAVSMWFNTMTSDSDQMLTFKKDADGNFVRSGRSNNYQLKNASYNFDSADGIIYTIDVSKPEFQRVTIISMNDGSPFDLQRKYSVAVNSYRGCGGGGHLTKGAKIKIEELESRTLSISRYNLRYELMKWIENKKIISPKPHTNWSVIPLDWTSKARIRDYEFLFGK